MTVGVCQKHPNVQLKYSAIYEGNCPTCEEPMDILDPKDQPAYGKCPCCGWCWRADSKAVYVVLERRSGVAQGTQEGKV